MENVNAFRKSDVAVSILLFISIATMLPVLPGMVWDVEYSFRPWTLHIFRNGLGDAYGSGTNYMPVMQYIYWVFGQIQGSEQSIIHNFAYVRLVTLLFDYLGIWYIYKWLGKTTPFYLLLIYCTANIAYLYNSIIWGQVDGILATLSLISLYLAWKGKVVWSTLTLVLTLNFKLQGIVIIPLWALLNLNTLLSFSRSAIMRTLTSSFLAAIFLQLGIVAPFILHNGIAIIANVFTQSFSQFPSVSYMAANIWCWITGQNDLREMSDQGIWLWSITYKTGGFVMFFTASFFALLPVLRVVLQNMRGTHKVKIPAQMVWLTAGLLYLLFYFLNTEMHERYCHPAFIFITAYTFSTRKFFPWIVFSCMYFLLLELTVNHLKLANYDTLIFDYRFLAGLAAVVIVYLYYQLYKLSRCQPAETPGTAQASGVNVSPEVSR
jgi:Gpi18-like mannosyltransferase